MSETIDSPRYRRDFIEGVRDYFSTDVLEFPSEYKAQFTSAKLGTTAEGHEVLVVSYMFVGLACEDSVQYTFPEKNHWIETFDVDKLADSMQGFLWNKYKNAPTVSLAPDYESSRRKNPKKNKGESLHKQKEVADPGPMRNSQVVTEKPLREKLVSHLQELTGWSRNPWQELK